MVQIRKRIIVLSFLGLLLVTGQLKAEFHKIQILLTNPRTVSTAFERSMMVRGDHKILHEPWETSYVYHCGNRDLFNETPPTELIEAKNYEEVKALIYKYAKNSPVFVKDMIWCMAEEFLQDDEILSNPNVVIAFLIREPSKSIESLFMKGLVIEKLSPEKMLESIRTYFRLDALVAIAEKYRHIRGKWPIIIESEELCLDSKKTLTAYCQQAGIPFMLEMLNWKPEMPDEWKHYASWHLDAAESSSFFIPKRHEAKQQFSMVAAKYVPSLEQIYQEQKSFYEKLKKYANKN
jgi:hypothetical protein